MRPRAAIYARYSSDLQSQASIEDQVRLCAERCKKEGWEVAECYTDAGISGASLLRPGIQMLIADARDGKFDIVVAEALDRLSRDQEDIAGLYKRTEFAGAKIVTLSEGEISSLHIGLKGTMNAMFLKDLADKTRRGLRGRVERGRSGGGIAYGYRAIKQMNSNGEAERGIREIDQAQAAVIRVIFEDYAHHNKSPKAIAAALNRDGVPGPWGKSWSQSTINGNRRRGTGILNNELYIGILVWNRQRYIKDPATGRRVTRLNPQAEWVRKDVPELRIINQELWEAAKSRQRQLDEKEPGLWQRKRPRHLLSGLLRCGQCGGGYAKISADRYGCANARNRGAAICDNKRSIAGRALEGAVLGALQSRLLHPDLVEVFCAEYTAHLNALRRAQGTARKSAETEASKLEKERENIIRAIKDGVPAALVKADLETLAARLDELKARLAQEEPEPRPLLHPTMARRYRQEVENLRTSLEQDARSGEAAEHIRALIEKVVMTPREGGDGLSIDLYGDLAGILQIAAQTSDREEKPMTPHQKQKRLAANDNREAFSLISLVAGVGFEPTTFGL